MANVVINEILQDLGAGSDMALALKEFSGLVLTAYMTETVALQYALKKTITSGNSHQFPATWKMNAQKHVKGTELVGNNEPINEERIIAVDAEQLVGHAYLDSVDDFIKHYDTRQERAVQASRAIARITDHQLFRTVIKGAGTAARGPGNEFPAGNSVNRAGATVAAAYPVSLTGSLALQSDMAEVAQTMDEKDVPRDPDTRHAFITPYLERVLRQDNTLLSRDYQAPNDKLTRKVVEVEGFIIHRSNNMPNIADSQLGQWEEADGEVEVNYQGDFALNVCCMIGDSTAFGQVAFGGIIPFGPTWIDDKLSWLIGARHLQGAKWLRPEACGTIVIDG